MFQFGGLGALFWEAKPTKAPKSPVATVLVEHNKICLENSGQTN